MKPTLIIPKGKYIPPLGYFRNTPLKKQKIIHPKISFKNQLLDYIDKNGIYKHNWNYRILVLKQVKEEIKINQRDIIKIKRLILFKRLLKLSLHYYNKRFVDKFTLHYIKNFDKLYEISNNDYKYILDILKLKEIDNKEIQKFFNSISL